MGRRESTCRSVHRRFLALLYTLVWNVLYAMRCQFQVLMTTIKSFIKFEMLKLWVNLHISCYLWFSGFDKSLAASGPVHLNKWELTCTHKVRPGQGNDMQDTFSVAEMCNKITYIRNVKDWVLHLNQHFNDGVFIWRSRFTCERYFFLSASV